MDRIRVLLADDDERYTRTLATYLGLHDDIEVVGFSKNGRQAVEDYRRFGPDVVVMDVYMPELDGLEAAAAIRMADSGARIVMLSAHDSAEVRTAAKEAGVSSFVSKQDAARDLLADIRRVGHQEAGEAEVAPVALSIAPDEPAADSAMPLDIVVTVSISLKAGGWSVGGA